MIPKKIEDYNEFVFTLTPDEQQFLELKKSGLKRLAGLKRSNREGESADGT